MTTEPAVASESSKVLRWLHISDIHFKENETWDRRATLRALIAKARTWREKNLTPDFVFVTGDIAFSGKAKEYEHATRFLHELNNVLELDPKNRWFLVPGNHDVDRSRITRSQRAIQNELRNEKIVEETLRDAETMRLLSTRLEAYYAFADDFLGHARTVRRERPWRTDVREIAGVSIGILQLNSAWVAEGGEADNANLLIGEAQVREALDETSETTFRIALMHHPLRNLREFDAHRVESLLAAPGEVFFVLRGHLHLNRTKLQDSPDGRFYEFAAGTLYTDEERWPRGFQLGEVDLGSGEARLHLFRFSDEGHGFFAPDNLSYENVPGGVCKMKLRGVGVECRKASPRAVISDAQRLSLTTRYRQAAANYHGYARFIGFPNQTIRLNARVSDLFVPLRMKPRRAGRAEGKSRTTAEIAQRLLSPLPGGAPRIVVLGDPGTGKTTLSRFLVMLAAGGITLPGVEVAGEPLPLRIALRDFLEKRRERASFSLIEYLELQARVHLSLTLPENFLRNALENSQAMLLLDGLDEVGTPEQRLEMRDLVAAFCAAHRNVPVIITSRIAGYDEAPLSATLSEVEDYHLLVRFNEFLLEKFDDDSLRTFVTYWYNVQEPVDALARDRGIADLLAVLNSSCPEMPVGGVTGA